MTREAAIAAVEAYFDDGGFAADLARRVAIPTESQVEGRGAVLQSYLEDEIAPTLAKLGLFGARSSTTRCTAARR